MRMKRSPFLFPLNGKGLRIPDPYFERTRPSGLPEDGYELYYRWLFWAGFAAKNEQALHQHTERKHKRFGHQFGNPGRNAAPFVEEYQQDGIDQ